LQTTKIHLRLCAKIIIATQVKRMSFTSCTKKSIHTRIRNIKETKCIFEQSDLGFFNKSTRMRNKKINPEYSLVLVCSVHGLMSRSCGSTTTTATAVMIIAMMMIIAVTTTTMTTTTMTTTTMTASTMASFSSFANAWAMAF